MGPLLFSSIMRTRAYTLTQIDWYPIKASRSVRSSLSAKTNTGVHKNMWQGAHFNGTRRNAHTQTQCSLCCCNGEKWRRERVDWQLQARQCGWELCLHRVRHKAAKAARPSACRLPRGDILRGVEWRNEAKALWVVNPKWFTILHMYEAATDRSCRESATKYHVFEIYETIIARLAGTEAVIGAKPCCRPANRGKGARTARPQSSTAERLPAGSCWAESRSQRRAAQPAPCTRAEWRVAGCRWEAVQKQN